MAEEKGYTNGYSRAETLCLFVSARSVLSCVAVSHGKSLKAKSTGDSIYRLSSRFRNLRDAVPFVVQISVDGVHCINIGAVFLFCLTDIIRRQR